LRRCPIRGAVCALALAPALTSHDRAPPPRIASHSSTIVSFPAIEESIPMLQVEVRLADEPSYWRLVEIVRGEEVHPSKRSPDGSMLAHVLMTPEQFAEATRQGFECRVLTDYDKEPDRRGEISKSNRFEAELRRLRGQGGAP